MLLSKLIQSKKLPFFPDLSANGKPIHHSPLVTFNEEEQITSGFFRIFFTQIWDPKWLRKGGNLGAKPLQV